MIQITEYFPSDLEEGECRSCSEQTLIVKGDGRCPDCIEDQKFYEMTMKGMNGKNDDFDDD